MGWNPTAVMPHCYKLKVFICQKQFENNKQDTFNCIDYIGRISEWSKALVSGTSRFDGVGLNPTPVMLHCYKLTVLTAKEQFENNKQHILNCIDYICKVGEWYQSLVSGINHFDGVGLYPTPVILHY